MTRSLTLLSAALTVLALVPASQAQDFKVGYVDTDQIVIRMPEFAQVQQQLRQQQQVVSARVRTVQDSLGGVLETRIAEYETFDQSALATDEARRERQTEILQLQAAREQAEAEGLQYLSYVEARLLQPVLTRVDEAIQAERQEGGYDLILPTVANNAPVFLAASERVVDLTIPIMTRLGVDPNAPPVGQQQPAATPPVAPPADGAVTPPVSDNQ